VSRTATASAQSIPELAPHQLAAMEQIRRTLSRYSGVLLADDVGLGKSWIAGAIAREFHDSGQVVEILVPRALVIQWQVLLESFRVDAALMTHDSLHGKFTFPGGAKPGLLIVDEAHRFRNPSTNRYRALALRSVGRRVLLVTATPICNRLEDLRALLHLMVSDDALTAAGVFSIEKAFEEGRRDQIAILSRELIIRRTRMVLPRHLQFGTLRREVVRFPLPRGEESIRADLALLRFPLVAAEPNHQMLQTFLWRRLESSPAAFRDSIRRQIRFYHRARESAQQGCELTKLDYRRIFGPDSDEVVFQELLFREFWTLPSAPAADLVRRVDQELSVLQRLDSRVAELEDQKAELLLGIVSENASEQILIFTAALATARDLFRRIGRETAAALLSSRLRWVRAGRRRTFEQVLESFRRGDARVLILTDLGAEGLNLQNASVVVHYDLPWNPVRLEQRDGRIHRIGQIREAVRALYFLPEARSNRLVIRRLAAKNRLRRRVWNEQHPGSHHPSAELLRSRGILRPRLSRNEPQAKMMRRLDGMRRLHDLLGDLLSRRYRAGVEAVIGQMAAEFLDRDRLSYLEDLLETERGLIDSTGAGEIVEGQ
jgi:superfamily II DNA or RNA helicase